MIQANLKLSWHWKGSSPLPSTWSCQVSVSTLAFMQPRSESLTEVIQLKANHTNNKKISKPKNPLVFRGVNELTQLPTHASTDGHWGQKCMAISLPKRREKKAGRTACFSIISLASAWAEYEGWVEKSDRSLKCQKGKLTKEKSNSLPVPLCGIWMGFISLQFPPLYLFEKSSDPCSYSYQTTA